MIKGILKNRFLRWKRILPAFLLSSAFILIVGFCPGKSKRALAAVPYGPMNFGLNPDIHYNSENLETFSGAFLTQVAGKTSAEIEGILQAAQEKGLKVLIVLGQTNPCTYWNSSTDSFDYDLFISHASTALPLIAEYSDTIAVATVMNEPHWINHPTDICDSGVPPKYIYNLIKRIRQELAFYGLTDPNFLIGPGTWPKYINNSIGSASCTTAAVPCGREENQLSEAEKKDGTINNLWISYHGPGWSESLEGVIEQQQLAREMSNGKIKLLYKANAEKAGSNLPDVNTWFCQQEDAVFVTYWDFGRETVPISSLLPARQACDVNTGDGSSLPPPSPTCGDGNIDTGEECDPPGDATQCSTGICQADCTCPEVSPPSAPDYDLSGDDRVDENDVSILLQSWGAQQVLNQADFNSDGVVGGIDFAMLLQAFTSPPPPQTHKECRDDQCVEVSGSGTDQCLSDADCVVLPPSPSLSGEMIGVQAAGSDSWTSILEWGGRVTSYPGYQSKNELLATLDQAEDQGIKVIDRWPGREAFSSGGKLDMERARDIAEDLYGDGQVSAHPAYGGSYAIDEPGNPQIWSMVPGDLDNFYTMIKSVDPNVQLIINFSWLDAARNLNAANAADVAGFTYTGVRPPGHWESQAAVARELKQANPDLIVSPWIAVWAYPAQNYPIPTAEWVREQGMTALSFDVFDGVFFYPWQHYPFTGETIVDVANDPAYISAFSDVFDAARAKWNQLKREQ